MSNTKLRVGIVIPAFFYVPYWAAERKGWYAAHGLDVEIIMLSGIEGVTRQLKAGEIDIGVGSPEHVIHDVERGGDLRMIGGNVNRLTHSLIVQQGINTLTDLRGKRLGVATITAGTSSLFMGILEELGLHYPGDYEVVECGAVPPRHKMLLSGEIDAGMQTDPHNYMAEDEGLTNLGSLSQWIPDFQFTSINVRDAWAKQNTKTVTHFLEATLQGTDFMVNDREGAVDIAEEFMRIPRRYLERAWVDHSGGAVSLDLHLNHAGIDTALQLIKRDRTGAYDVAENATPEKYVDASYLKAAQRATGRPEHVFS
ncbi:MAG: ABC transporter substrate-binding protein [Pseudomonadota bacterium]